jgi:hypothetical protein
MLPTIIDRLNHGKQAIVSAVHSHRPDHICTSARRGYVFQLDAKHNRAKNCLLVDIDSLLFELNALSDCIKVLVGLLHDCLRKPLSHDDAGKWIQRVLKGASQDTGWFSLLDRHRNYFIHEATPYIAVDASSADLNRYELLIMKDNLKNFSDRARFFTFTELALIVAGFRNTMPVLRGELTRLIDNA